MAVSRQLGVLCLILLVCMAHATEAGRRKKHHRHHHKMRDMPVAPPFYGAGFVPPVGGAFPAPMMGVGVPPPVAAAAVVPPTPDVFPRFEQTTEQAQSQTKGGPGGNIVQAFYNMLSKSRDMNVEDSGKLAQLKKINEEQFETIKEKSKLLRDRQNMLTRLEYCLEQDNTKSAKASEKAKADKALLDQIAAKTESNAKKEGLLNAQESSLKTREAKLAAALADLKAKQAAADAKMAEAQKLQAKVTAAQAAPPKEVIKTVVQKVPEIVYKVAPTGCPSVTDCGTCAATPHCGWCQSSGKCLDSPNGTTSLCDADSWSYNFCKHDSCAKHVHCRSCMADPRCGMCADTGVCSEGSLTGPSSGSCNAWSYATDMRFLSYNMYGRDLRNITGRAEWLFRMIRQADADFVALQEVEDWFLEALSKEKWAMNYHMSDFGSGHAPGGLLMLSKIPLESVSYYEKTDPGQVEVDQRARFLAVKPKMGSRNMVLANTLLDWRNPNNRVAALEYMFSVLNASSDVVAMGDFNFDSGALPESMHLPRTYTDLWPRVHPTLKGYTWDPEQNSYARESDPTSRPSRIDRMLVKSGFWQPSKIDKIGAPEASPHYGLLAEFSMFGAYC